MRPLLARLGVALPGMPLCAELLAHVKGELAPGLRPLGVILDPTKPISLVQTELPEDVVQVLKRGVLLDSLNEQLPDLPADMLFKKRAKRKDVLGSFTLTAGLSTITDTVALEPGVTLLTGQDVSSIEPSGAGFTIAAGGERYHAGYLALAVPPPSAAGLIKGANPELAKHLSKVKVGHVETVGVALYKDDVQLSPVAGIIASGDCFYSAVSRDTVKDEKFRGFAFHFKPGLMDLDGKMKRIGEVLKVGPAAIRQHVEKDNNYVPSLAAGHAGWAAEADRLIGGSRLLLTGNYFGGVAIEDCVSRSYDEFIRMRKGASTP